MSKLVMPHVAIDSPAGAVDMYYWISTPSAASSTHIVPNLPCILFLHSGYIGAEVFEPQFQDSRLRQNFNLVAVNMRGYGQSKGMIYKQKYTPADSADEIRRFIKAAGLPPLHIFGLALGCCIGVELATRHPELVLSLTLCSPLPGCEPEDIVSGRIEVYNLWAQAFHDDGNGAVVEVDESVLNHLIGGAQQLCFNNERNHLTNAMTKLGLRNAMDNRAGSPDKLRFSYQISIGLFLNRQPHSPAALSNIRCPISIIHCDDDIAYPLSEAQEFEASLRRAGLDDVALYQVHAPHYGSVVNPQEINPILLDVALSASFKDKDRSNRMNAYHLGGDPSEEYSKMVTPFGKSLAQYGYTPFEDEAGSDSDDS